jgi:hypothetical protein
MKVFDQKGQIRIIESFLAIAVVFSAVLISVTFPNSPDFSKQNSLSSLGTQVLIELDNDGTLGSIILQQNWTRLTTALDILLPMGVSFNLTVFDQAGQTVNSGVIQNSNILGPDVVSVQYVCATRSQTVKLFVVRLQLAWTG